MNKKSMFRSIGSYLRKARMESGLTQDEVAIKLGYTTSQLVSNFERGVCGPPEKKLSRLVKLYKIDGWDLHGLITRENETYLEKVMKL